MSVDDLNISIRDAWVTHELRYKTRENLDAIVANLIDRFQAVIKLLKSSRNPHASWFVDFSNDQLGLLKALWRDNPNSIQYEILLLVLYDLTGLREELDRPINADVDGALEEIEKIARDIVEFHRTQNK